MEEVLYLFVGIIIGAIAAALAVRYMPSVGSLVFKSYAGVPLASGNLPGTILGIMLTNPSAEISNLVLKTNQFIKSIVNSNLCAQKDQIKKLITDAKQKMSDAAKSSDPSSCIKTKQDLVDNFKKGLFKSKPAFVTSSDVAQLTNSFESFINAFIDDLCTNNAPDPAKLFALLNAALDSICP